MPGRPTARAGTRPSCASSAERSLPSRDSRRTPLRGPALLTALPSPP